MSIGPTEIIIVLILALLVFGPKRLPQMGKSLGRGVREFKHAAETAKDQLGLSEVIDDVTQVKNDVLSAAGVDEIKESIAGVTSSIDDVKASVGVGEITAGVGSIKSAMSLDPKKVAKGLVTGKPAADADAKATADAVATGDADAAASSREPAAPASEPASPEPLADEELVPAVEA